MNRECNNKNNHKGEEKEKETKTLKIQYNGRDNNQMRTQVHQ